ncbi:MAG: hypothetical protein AAF335_04575 [Bacteroidota bacterium]
MADRPLDLAVQSFGLWQTVFCHPFRILKEQQSQCFSNFFAGLSGSFLSLPTTTLLLSTTLSSPFPPLCVPAHHPSFIPSQLLYKRTPSFTDSFIECEFCLIWQEKIFACSTDRKQESCKES